MRTLITLPTRVYSFSGEYQSLFDLEDNKISDRRYRLPSKVHSEIVTDVGTLISDFDEGFEFDGRSGPKIIDWYVPNLGSVLERLAWLNHDGCAYATCIDFKSTNRILQLFLKDQVGYSWCKSKLVETAVSLSKSWYGIPEPSDTWYCNLGKFNLEWKDIRIC